MYYHTKCITKRKKVFRSYIALIFIIIYFASYYKYFLSSIKKKTVKNEMKFMMRAVNS